MTAISSSKLVDITLGSALARIRARGNFNKIDAEDFIPTPESLLLYIDTPIYDGPLDLLLHLIRKHSMDIFDIPIVTITDKYLSALEDMSNLNLDVMGEFLVMAATLAEIKSKMLLPKEEQTSFHEEEGEDPRAGLIKKLLLYKSFQDISLQLNNKFHLDRDWFYRPIIEEEEIEIDISNHDIAPIAINELLLSLTSALKKAEHIEIHTITKDHISVFARLRELLELCELRSHFTFFEAINYFLATTKMDVIITFLALLELAKLKLIRIYEHEQYNLKIVIIKDNLYINKQQILQNLSSHSIEDEYE